MLCRSLIRGHKKQVLEWLSPINLKDFTGTFRRMLEMCDGVKLFNKVLYVTPLLEVVVERYVER